MRPPAGDVGDITEHVAAQLICPSGRFATPLSSPSAKNIPLPRLVETALLIPPSRPMRGAIAIVTNAARDAVDARRRF
jgi:hypothetical protein